MWCKSCRQDVPGIVSPGEKRYCCARCGAVMQVESTVVGRHTAAPPNTTRPASEAAAENLGQRVTPRYDPWELNEKLRHIERVLHGGRMTPGSRSDSLYRWDSPPAPAPVSPARSQAPWVRMVSWPLLALGLGIFACGAALVGLSLVSGRGELWRLGLPTVLAGQFALLLALVVQVAGHSIGRKAANRQVRQLDEQLETIRRSLADRGVLRESR